MPKTACFIPHVGPIREDACMRVPNPVSPVLLVSFDQLLNSILSGLEIYRLHLAKLGPTTNATVDTTIRRPAVPLMQRGLRMCKTEAPPRLLQRHLSREYHQSSPYQTPRQSPHRRSPLWRPHPHQPRWTRRRRRWLPSCHWICDPGHCRLTRRHQFPRRYNCKILRYH